MEGPAGGTVAAEIERILSVNACLREYTVPWPRMKQERHYLVIEATIFFPSLISSVAVARQRVPLAVPGAG